ncbi:hypothetical protein NDK50_12655 [Paraburkholderia bryophila]|uniref:hypothetical protein n=1 Tax=Paraburkholderia bryophila TaxID=420952 RepID=UPI002349FE34|nr:hypothetical protein [Paraburkholderia bryophila]WCM18315.1 hypothetical protein NDK50_12655 [Paraburkholderia bryophila]
MLKINQQDPEIQSVEAKTVVTYLRCITHFARWAHFGQLRRQRINEVLIAEFLDEHLPQCECLTCIAIIRRARPTVIVAVSKGFSFWTTDC